MKGKFCRQKKKKKQLGVHRHLKKKKKIEHTKKKKKKSNRLSNVKPQIKKKTKQCGIPYGHQ